MKTKKHTKGVQQMIEIKRATQKSKALCDVNCFNSRSNLCSKSNYSDVTSVKPLLPQSFFFVFIQKIFENWAYIIEVRAYSSGLTPLPLNTRTPLSYPHPLPYLRTYLMDGPYWYNFKKPTRHKEGRTNLVLQDPPSYLQGSD